MAEGVTEEPAEVPPDDSEEPTQVQPPEFVANLARTILVKASAVDKGVWMAVAIVFVLLLAGGGGYKLVTAMLAEEPPPPPDPRSSFHVRFDEKMEDSFETTFIEDQTTYPATLELKLADGWAVAYVEVTVHFAESDEAGLGLCDQVSAIYELGGVEGGSGFGGEHEGSSTDCNSPTPQIVLRAVVNGEYDGEPYTAENAFEEEIFERWGNGGAGVGTYINDVTVEIVTLYDITESGEEVDIAWRAVIYMPIVESVPL
jgi:hypothetical protein